MQKQVITCPTCNGEGSVRLQAGTVNKPVTCPKCGGRKTVMQTTESGQTRTTSILTE